MMGKNALGLDVDPPVSPKVLLGPGYYTPYGYQPRQPASPKWMGPSTKAHRLIVVFAIALLSGTLWLASSPDPLTQYQRPAAAQDLPRAQATRGFRILHLIDKETHESVMDRWFQRSDVAFSGHKNVEEAIYWGPGFAGYDTNTTLVKNIETRFGFANHFDAVLPYWNKDQTVHLHLDSSPWFAQIAQLSQRGSVIIDRAHEMRDLRRAEMYREANVTLVLSPYAHELWDYKGEFETRALLVHQPHSVDVELFHHPVEADRAMDVFLAGSLEEIIYPLRARLGHMIEDKKLPGHIRGHPGYPDIQPKEVRSARNISSNSLDDQLVDYAAALGNAKICFVTTSRFLYSVQKYSEAALAGCLVIGNLPADRHDAFADFVVPISMKNTDAEIVATVKRWLADDEGRKAKALRAQRYFSTRFSSQRYVDDVIRWVGLIRDGQRGLVLPHQWDFIGAELPWDG